MSRIINEEITEVPVDALRHHPRNPNQGDVGAIFESIEANGFYGALVVQRSTGYVLAGNHRLKAAREAGLASVPVAYVDVDDERALRILLADNRTSELATRDQEALASLLTELAGSDDALSGSGYDGDDLDRLIADLGDGYLDDSYARNSGFDDSIDTYQNTTLRQIVLLMQVEEYEWMIDALEAACDVLGLSTNYDVVHHLLAEWEASHG